MPKKTDPNDLFHICARVEGLADSFTTRPWPTKRITYCIDPSGYNGPLPRATIVAAFKEAWLDYADQIDIEPVQVDNDSQAMVRTKFGSVDGSRSVLAWSELSDGTTTPKRQLFDKDEDWSWEEHPTSKIDLQRVACHEIGHVLGLTHDADNADALLAPMYSPSIRSPRPRDIARLQMLGYQLRPLVPPVGSNPPPVTPPPPPIVPPVKPGGIVVDKATIKLIVDQVFAGLKTTFGGRPVVAFIISAAQSLVDSWLDSLQTMTAEIGSQELNKDRVKSIIGFIFSLLKQWAAASPEMAATFDEMHATATSDAAVADVVARLRSQNVKVS